MKLRILLSKLLTIVLLLTTVRNGMAAPVTQVPERDSLSLREIIDIVVREHPSVSMAQEAINNANARIGLAKTGYLPEADFTANYSNMGPVTKISIPNMGTFQLFPENNYSASINYRQVIYDFGRTRQNIEMEQGNKIIGEKALEQTRQKLSMLAVNNYFTLVYLQWAIRIKEEQIKTLNEHLEHVKKMYETGTATEYLVLSTKVRISNVESQKVDLETALSAQQAFLVSLAGDKKELMPVVKNDLVAEVPVLPSDSLNSVALKNRDEMKLEQEKAAIASLRYEMVKLQNKPLLSLQASAGAKNGYLPSLMEPKPNYIVGIVFRVPIFDGTKNRYNLLQAKSAMQSINYETESTRRTVINELSDSRAYMTAAEQKIGQASLQLQQAEKAFSLAQTSFNSGVITNLDLLDANTAMSESRLMMLKARIDYAASVYRFRAALGERLY